MAGNYHSERKLVMGKLFHCFAYFYPHQTAGGDSDLVCWIASVIFARRCWSREIQKVKNMATRSTTKRTISRLGGKWISCLVAAYRPIAISSLPIRMPRVAILMRFPIIGLAGSALIA